jgi:NAD(P)-dependent dehydrogenase (short-subunit alcohol dehydrogenase family)
VADRFDGRAVIVTGAGSGIGRATALAFAAEGARVIASDVTADRVEDTVRSIADAGGSKALAVQADVRDARQVESLVQRAIDDFGRLDVLVNNAGVEGVLAPTAEAPEEAFDSVIAINLKGVWLGMRYAIPRMVEAGGGAIVNVASILGTVGMATAAAYTASKHGVVGLTKAAALEYSSLGIRVNAVGPGFIETPMVMERGVKAGSDEQAYAQLVGLHPIGRLGTSEEIAAAILWLASDDASFVTGHTLIADGGYTAQ